MKFELKGLRHYLNIQPCGKINNHLTLLLPSWFALVDEMFLLVFPAEQLYVLLLGNFSHCGSCLWVFVQVLSSIIFFCHWPVVETISLKYWTYAMYTNLFFTWVITRISAQLHFTVKNTFYFFYFFPLRLWQIVNLQNYIMKQ